MSTTGEEGKPLSSEISLSSQRGRRVKFIVGAVLTLLCVAGALAACAAVVSIPASQNNQDLEASQPQLETDLNTNGELNDGNLVQRSTTNEPDYSHERENENEEEEEEEEYKNDTSRVSRRARDCNAILQMNCYSSQKDNPLPSAHIRGANCKWPIQQGVADYQTYWDCEPYEDRPDSSPDAYVHGGMSFLHTDNRLYVPKCGFYHIFSQIIFKVPRSESMQEIYHQVRYVRNCSAGDNRDMVLTSHETVPPSRNVTVMTSQTSDVVKLCEGGYIWISIPAGNGRSACCPTSGRSAFGWNTYFGAVLVGEDDCNWPVDESLSMN